MFIITSLLPGIFFRLSQQFKMYKIPKFVTELVFHVANYGKKTRDFVTSPFQGKFEESKGIVRYYTQNQINIGLKLGIMIMFSNSLYLQENYALYRLLYCSHILMIIYSSISVREILFSCHIITMWTFQ